MLGARSIKNIYFFVVVVTIVWIAGALLYGFGVCNDKDVQKRQDDLRKLELKLKTFASNVARQSGFKNPKISSDENYPWIYAVTPTYSRPVQKAELTRLAQTFMHVDNFHWIVVEDSKEVTPLVTNFLQRSSLQYTHLNIPTPVDLKLKSTDPNWLKPRGVLQRNLALNWLRNNVDPDRRAVVYFADDDNTYDLRLFDEMRHTMKVSVWPVGLVGGLRFERPLVHKGHVTGWYTFWKPDRPFAMDMAGFAINLKLLVEHENANFDIEVPRGYQESSLLSKLVTMSDLEVKASDCTEILVWHTRTEAAKLKNELRLKKMNRPVSDVRIEV